MYELIQYSLVIRQRDTRETKRYIETMKVKENWNYSLCRAKNKKFNNRKKKDRWKEVGNG